MDPDRFDVLTRRLATERSSRRGLLRGLGGGLAGAVLAGLGVQAAGAAPGGNSYCAQWCHATFKGKVAGQCTSQATRGRGPCYSCEREEDHPPNQTCPEDLYELERMLGSGCRTPPCCVGTGAPCRDGGDCCSGTCNYDYDDWTCA